MICNPVCSGGQGLLALSVAFIATECGLPWLPGTQEEALPCVFDINFHSSLLVLSGCINCSVGGPISKSICNSLGTIQHQLIVGIQRRADLLHQGGLSVFALEEGFDKNHDRRLGFNQQMVHYNTQYILLEICSLLIGKTNVIHKVVQLK